MKKSLLIAAIIAPSLLFAQTIENLNDSKLDVIYRYMPNEFKVIGDAELTKYDYELKCIDCVVTKKDSPENEFIIKPTNSTTAELILYGMDGTTTNYSFRVSNMPDAIITLNGVADGGTVDFKSGSKLELAIGFPEKVSLRNTSTIESFRVELTGNNEGVSLQNESKVFSESLTKTLKGLESGKTLKLIVSEVDAQNIRRKKELTFTAK